MALSINPSVIIKVKVQMMIENLSWLVMIRRQAFLWHFFPKRTLNLTICSYLTLLVHPKSKGIG